MQWRGMVGKFLWVGFVSLFAQTGQAADALQFFKNYIITGDYVTAGVGVRGTGINGVATGQITINPCPASPSATDLLTCVPANAEIVAAYLYWLTIEKSDQFSGQTSGIPKLNGKPVVGRVLGTGTPPCWSSGGSTGSSQGAINAHAYRADVLRNLPVLTFGAPPDTYQKRVATGTHVVQLPDSGNQLPNTEGASLVIVYRVPGAGAPLKGIILVDGAYTLDQKHDFMDQTLQGFYQTSYTTAPRAKLTHIVADGQQFPEVLYFNGTQIAANPFTGAQGYSWDNYTRDVSSLVPAAAPGVASVTTRVDHAGSNVFDCLSWTAIVFSVTLEDPDNDGLLSIWETKGFNETITRDPLTGNVTSASFGTCEDAPATCVNLPAMGADPNRKDIFLEVDGMIAADHTHFLKYDAAKAVYDAFQRAPGGPINVHFDVGPFYQPPQVPAVPWIIPQALAQGGDLITEQSVTCIPTPTRSCVFPNYPGVVGMLAGLRSIQARTKPGSLDPSITVFRHNRSKIFHHVFMAHAMGVKADPNCTGNCQPSSTSGQATRPGRDLVMAFGLWPFDDAPGCTTNGLGPNTCNDKVGSVRAQSGTLLHELAHNFGVNHAGTIGPSTPAAPLCKSNFPSVVNYLYQVSGLNNYSQTVLPALNENSLSESWLGGVSTMVPVRWYGPPSALDIKVLGVNSRLAKRHCDGTPLVGGEVAIRLETPAVTSSTDWNNDGIATANPYPQDINFNGKLDASLVGSADWFLHDYRQMGGTINANGLSADVDPTTELAGNDPQNGDWANGDWANGDWANGDWANGDWANGVTDQDYETATANVEAPTGLNATVGKTAVTLKWSNASSLNLVRQNDIYRATGTTATADTAARIGSNGSCGSSQSPPSTTFDDSTAKNNTTYTYFVTAYDKHCNQSGPSNMVTVTK